MARYDRIARLDLPERDGAFNGWFTLRDMDGREREPELGRRARLRYLALRPLHRMLKRGLGGIDTESLNQQIETLRAEIDQLPRSDPERQRLENYLIEVGGRSPGGLARATTDLGAAAEAAGYLFAAEEFYRCGIELARRHGLTDQTVLLLRYLGRLLRTREQWDEAITALREAALLAASSNDAIEWARCMEGVAVVEARRGDPAAARTTLEEIEQRAPGDGGGQAGAIAAAGRCSLELSEGHTEAALNAGWRALEGLAPEDEARAGVLLDMGTAFRRLGLHDGAASAYRIVRQWAAWPEHRLEAEMELASVAAEAGDADAYRRHREAVEAGLDGVDRPLQAMLNLGLARGAVLVGDIDTARELGREAVATARDLGRTGTLERAEELLADIENRPDPDPAPVEEADAVSPEAEAIADRLEGLVAAS